jgi:hypothetical protein
MKAIWIRIACMIAVVAGVTALAIVGCKSHKNDTSTTSASSGPGPLQQGSGYAHVTYRPNVRIMEQEEGKKALIGVSTNEASLLFDSSNATARALKTGDVLMIKGVLARVVLGAEATPDGIIVLTQQAALTDLIQDGEIHMQIPVRFSAQNASLTEPGQGFFSALPDLFAPPLYAQSPENAMANQARAQGNMDAYKGLMKGAVHSIIDGWNMSFQSTPADGRTNLNLQLTRSEAGFVASVTGQGSVSNFDFDSDIGIQQSKIQQMKTNFSNLTGEMTFNWVVAKDSAGVMAEESRIKLPGVVDVPLAEFVGGLPLYLQVSGAIMIHPAITGGKEITKGTFRVTYTANQSFVVNSGSVNAGGTTSGDIDLGDHQDISPTAPLGMLVAVAAPRIELTLGLGKIYDKSDIKKAADIVDSIADAVAKRLMSPANYQDYQQNGFHFGKTFGNALKTDAAAYFQIIGTSASSFTGFSAISPCSRYDLNIVASVGASAEAWGQSIASINKEIYRKDMTKVDPPGMKLCEDIGKN